MPATESATSVAAVQREVERSLLRLRNGIGNATGIRRTKVGLTPKETVWSRDKVELWRYHNSSISKAPPVFVVMSLVTRSYILDLRPGNSYVGRLLDAGFDVFLLDWGTPDEAESANTLATYVDRYLPAAMDAACREARSADLSVIGYCLGGFLALLTVALHADSPVRNLVTMATPTDFRSMGLLAGMVREGRVPVDHLIDRTGNVPAGVIREAFRIRKPTADLVKYVNLWENLWNDQYVDGYQAMNQWVNDHIPFPGAAAREMVPALFHQDALRRGRLRVGGRRVRLDAVRCPVLNVVAERDDVVPVASAEQVLSLVGSSDKEELRLPSGHVALVAGRSAANVTLPGIIDWIAARSARRRRKAAFP